MAANVCQARDRMLLTSGPEGCHAVSSRYLQLNCSQSCCAGPQREKPMDWDLPKVVLECFLDCAELFFEKATRDFN